MTFDFDGKLPMSLDTFTIVPKTPFLQDTPFAKNFSCAPLINQPPPNLQESPVPPEMKTPEDADFVLAISIPAG